jgi:hypothetical protein
VVLWDLLFGSCATVPGARCVAAEKSPDERTIAGSSRVDIVATAILRRPIAGQKCQVDGPSTLIPFERSQHQTGFAFLMTTLAMGAEKWGNLMAERDPTSTLHGKCELRCRSSRRLDKSIRRGQLGILVTSNTAAILPRLDPDPVAGGQSEHFFVQKLELDREIGWNLDMERAIILDRCLAQESPGNSRIGERTCTPPGRDTLDDTETMGVATFEGRESGIALVDVETVQHASR